jgi:hypothetical protein
MVGWPAVRALIVLMMAGCNWVFDVEPTGLAIEPPPPPVSDSDADGVINGDDNCVLVANPDQLDGDGDMLGDACDPCLAGDTQIGADGDNDGIDDGCDSCLKGINHDEDGDGLGDGCDVCPGVSDPTPSDGDADGVGDACDSALTQRRIFFDGFGPPNDAWNTGFKPWKATTDGYTPSNPTVGNPADGPWNANAFVMGSGIRVVASVIVPPPMFVAYEERVGINMRMLPNGMPGATCALRGEQGEWVVVNDSSMTVIPAGRTVFTLVLQAASPGLLQMSCTIGPVTVTPMAFYGDDLEFVPSLVANAVAEYEWIDVLE